MVAQGRTHAQIIPSLEPDRSRGAEGHVEVAVSPLGSP
jgi:hypothetical protein